MKKSMKVWAFVAVLVMVTVLSAGMSSADIITSELTYFEGWPHGQEILDEFAHVSPTSPETLIDGPDYNSSKQLYGAYRLGNGNDTEIVFVIDESNGTGTGYDIVYVDSNNNENMTDDGGPHKQVPRATGLAFPVNVIVDYDVNGQDITGPYRIWTFFQKDYNRMGYSTNCYYEGLITIDGKLYNAYIYDKDADAIYNDEGHRLYIDLNGEKYYQVGDIFILNNLTYRIQYISPQGDIIQIQSPGNLKNIEKYGEREIFLISDEEWKDVLRIVSLSTWTEHGEVKKYPTLIYHNESNGFDADSIIYFYGVKIRLDF
jgi:hypothetical protein